VILPPTKRRNRISLGEYPKPVSLTNARAQRETLNDGGGLYLEVRDSGRKLWRFRYTRPKWRPLGTSKIEIIYLI